VSIALIGGVAGGAVALILIAGAIGWYVSGRNYDPSAHVAMATVVTAQPVPIAAPADQLEPMVPTSEKLVADLPPSAGDLVEEMTQLKEVHMSL
jgi:hypothetical protein